MYVSLRPSLSFPPSPSLSLSICPSLLPPHCVINSSAQLHPQQIRHTSVYSTRLCPPPPSPGHLSPVSDTKPSYRPCRRHSPCRSVDHRGRNIINWSIPHAKRNRNDMRCLITNELRLMRPSGQIIGKERMLGPAARKKASRRHKRERNLNKVSIC